MYAHGATNMAVDGGALLVQTLKKAGTEVARCMGLTGRDRV